MAYQIDLSGRVAMVTGASSGLGEQFARALSRAGAGVVLAARRMERLKTLRAELEAEAERLRDANRLRPMSEAPIDGTEFAVLVPLHAVGNDMYFRDRWCGEYGPIEGDGSWDEWTPGWLPMPESETKA